MIACNNDIFLLQYQVENNPYDPNLMVFMDYRDYMKQNVQCPEANFPTFLYAMPMSHTKVFFEVCSMFLSLVFFTLRVTVLLTLYVKMPIAGNLFSIKRCYAF